MNEDGKYVKLPGPEHNWVWSPQDVINMHCPELWGFVQFSSAVAGSPESTHVTPLSFDNEIFVKEVLMKVYYAQKVRFSFGSDCFTKSIVLRAVSCCVWDVINY